MKRLFLTLAGTVLMSGAAAAAAAQTQLAKGDAAHGKAIFVTYGCYQCHGYQGQGSNAGPKLAPNPLPYDAVEHQMRKPRDRMPVYTAKTVSEQDVADIYAYLQTIPKARPVAEIPLLKDVQ